MRIEGSKNHYGTGTRLYEIWKGMRKRCNCPYRKEYKNYGARGIRVCNEWDDYTKFRDWAIENGYTDNLTIDRIDCNKNYSSDNCRWVTIQEQQNHKRNNIYITIDSETHTLMEWTKKYNVDYNKVNRLIKSKVMKPIDALLTVMKA